MLWIHAGIIRPFISILGEVMIDNLAVCGLAAVNHQPTPANFVFFHRTGKQSGNYTILVPIFILKSQLAML